MAQYGRGESVQRAERIANRERNLVEQERRDAEKQRVLATAENAQLASEID